MRWRPCGANSAAMTPSTQLCPVCMMLMHCATSYTGLYLETSMSYANLSSSLLTSQTSLYSPVLPVYCLPCQAHGRVEVSHPRNSASASPDSAYSPLERALARLEALTDARPCCYDRYKDMYAGREEYERCGMCCCGWQGSCVAGGSHLKRAVLYNFIKLVDTYQRTC